MKDITTLLNPKCSIIKHLTEKRVESFMGAIVCYEGQRGAGGRGRERTNHGVLEIDQNDIREDRVGSAGVSRGPSVLCAPCGVCLRRVVVLLKILLRHPPALLFSGSPLIPLVLALFLFLSLPWLQLLPSPTFPSLVSL